jgi:hypothetical protein
MSVKELLELIKEDSFMMERKDVHGIDLKICCLNCHYYLSDYENCQGLEDIENEHCHEYKETLQ